jgi:hypothetical protein
MHRLRPSALRLAANPWVAFCACVIVLAGCAPLLGYPRDPEDTDATLPYLQQYFNGVREKDYFNPTYAAQRAQIRNEIILGRLHAYDITFADFEKRLYGDGNGVTLGGDLTALVLTGLTATMGGAATKSALGAASTGVIGAKAAIDKDLYYQKTIPALLAQMEADRLVAKLPIVAGLKLSDAEYPLIQAYIDLDAYKNAGSIPAAINAINKDTGNAKDLALDALRSTPFSEDTFSARLRAFIWPAGVGKPTNQPNLNKVRRWMSAHLPGGVPVEKFLDAPALARERMQAVADLSVP